MRAVLASRNSHKIIEVRRILDSVGVGLELVGLDDLDQHIPDTPETGATFADNALLKARAVSQVTGAAAIADDSGLCVDALNGMPGVLSARWAGAHGDDLANLELVLSQLADVPEVRRGAQFVCAVALVRPGVADVVAEGVVSGVLTTAPRGAGGFGYDPIFVPEGLLQTTAELSAEQKDELSHRGRALRELARLIN